MGAVESAQPAPDVGDIVEYGATGPGGEVRKYRVTAWLKPLVPESRLSGHDMLVAGAMVRELSPDQICEAVLHDTAPLQNPLGAQLEWCLRADATYVSLTGVGGGVAPIGKCRVIGRFEGAARHLADMVEFAQRLASRRFPSGIFVR